MALGVCLLLWLKIILEDLRIAWEGPMKLYCDNKSTINIVHNPVQHDRTKHVEIDRHFIKEKIEMEVIKLNYVPTNSQIANIFTKALPRTQFEALCSKLGMINIYCPA